MHISIVVAMSVAAAATAVWPVVFTQSAVYRINSWLSIIQRHHCMQCYCMHTDQKVLVWFSVGVTI
jgi:hypothetical protein